MNAGIRRALGTPPSPTKNLVGKTERAKNDARVERLGRVEQSQKAAKLLKRSLVSVALNEVAGM